MKNKFALLFCLFNFYLFHFREAVAQSYPAECSTAPAWVNNVGYPGGSFVKYNGILYKAHYWSYGENPASNYGPASSGQEWELISFCETSPTVTITSPSNNALFTAPATISIQTNATAYGSYAISKVEFYAGTAKIGEVSSAPYTFNWAASEGEYDLTAKVYDTRNAIVTSAPVNILVKLNSTNCSVPVWDPTVNYNSGSATVWYDGKVYKQRNGFPYSPAGTNPAANSGPNQYWELVGTCALHPTATSVTSPSNNDTLSVPGSITITADALDPETDIEKVEFYVGSTLLGSDASAPYSYSWSSASAGNHTITAKAVDMAGLTKTSAPVTFTIKSAPPLPVSLLSFKAIQQQNKVLLEWTTATETDNKGFEVQRSVNGKIFDPIDFVAGSGTSNNQQHYKTNDNAPLNGLVYYRLKQIDFSGRTEYSKIIAVSVADYAVNVNPNPVSEKLKIGLNVPSSQPCILILRDMLGKELYRAEHVAEGFTEITLDLGHFNAGIYLLSVQGGNQIIHQEKVMKK